MGGMLLPQILRQQPQQVAVLDQSNPLVRGLVFASVAGGPDLISGVFPVRMGAAALSTFDQGKTLYTSGVTNDGWYWPLPSNHPLYGITTQDTLFVLARRITGSSYNNLLGVPYRNGAWASPYYAWGLSGQNDNTMGAYSFATNISARNSVVSSPGLFSDGVTQAYGATRNGTRLRFYNGRQQFGTDGSIAAGSPDWTNKQPLMLFNHSNSSPGEGMQAHAGLVLVWSRELSPTEWASLAQNPWQLFASISPASRAAIAAASAGTAAAPAAALSGTATAGATATGSLSTAISLSGAASAQATATGALSAAIALSGAATAKATALASLTTQIALSGGASAGAAASATLTTATSISGATAGSASASAALSTGIALSGAASGGAVASGALSIGLALGGAATAQASASATLTTAVSLAGAAIAQAQASASLGTQAAALTGAALAGASTAAQLSTGISLAGAALARAVGQAALSTQIALVAIAQAQASASATLSANSQPVEPNGARTYVALPRVRLYIGRERVREL